MFSREFCEIFQTSSEANLEPCQTFKVNGYTKIVNGQNALTNFAKRLRLRCLTEF